MNHVNKRARDELVRNDNQRKKEDSCREIIKTKNKTIKPSDEPI